MAKDPSKATSGDKGTGPNGIRLVFGHRHPSGGPIGSSAAAPVSI